MTARTSAVWGALAALAFFASVSPVFANSTYSTIYHRPTCEVTIAYNQQINGYPTSAKLSWHSQNASTAFLSPDNIAVPLNDTRTVYPTGYQRYAITVYGKGGSYTCEVTGSGQGTVYSGVAPIYTYGTPYVPIPAYVQLAQLPYTGFDFGPVGNTIYFSVLGLFALGAAYALLYVLPNNAVGLALMREQRFVAQRIQHFLDTGR